MALVGSLMTSLPQFVQIVDPNLYHGLPFGLEFSAVVRAAQGHWLLELSTPFFPIELRQSDAAMDLETVGRYHW